MTAIATEIQVTRRCRDGWFVYTSDALRGLYVASKDDKKAYNDVPRAIEMLLKLETGADVKVYHKADYVSFMNRIELGDRALEAVEDRTREMMVPHQTTVFSFMIGETTNDFVFDCH